MIQHEYEGKTQFRSSHSRTAGVITSVRARDEQISLQIGSCFAGDMVLAAVRVGTLPDGVSSRRMIRSGGLK